MKKLVVRSLAILAPVALLAGCSSAPKKGESLSDIRHNLTPGMNTEDQRYVDVYNNLALGHNDNLRKLNSDGLRLMLLDRPSRLSPSPDAR
jgi:hypothetical protein